MLTLYRPKVSQFTGCFNKQKGVVQNRPASFQKISKLICDDNAEEINIKKIRQIIDSKETGTFPGKPCTLGLFAYACGCIIICEWTCQKKTGNWKCK